jgi:hypothetical protein
MDASDVEVLSPKGDHTDQDSTGVDHASMEAYGEEARRQRAELQESIDLYNDFDNTVPSLPQFEQGLTQGAKEAWDKNKMYSPRRDGVSMEIGAWKYTVFIHKNFSSISRVNDNTSVQGQGRYVRVDRTSKDPEKTDGIRYQRMEIDADVKAAVANQETVWGGVPTNKIVEPPYIINYRWLITDRDVVGEDGSIKVQQTRVDGRDAIPLIREMHSELKAAASPAAIVPAPAPTSR